MRFPVKLISGRSPTESSIYPFTKTVLSCEAELCVQAQGGPSAVWRRTRDIIYQLILTSVFVNACRRYLSKPRLSLTCEPITTPAQPPETLSVTPEYCRFASGVSVTTKSWHDNPPATCQTCVCAHLHFFTTFVFVSSRLYLMHSNCSFLRR